jgi:hypothetical protein
MQGIKRLQFPPKGEGAGVAAQRGHGIPGAPHTAAAGRRGMARLPRKQNRAPAVRAGPQHRVRTHASPPPGVGRAVESRENQSKVVHPWDAGSGRLSRGAQALWPLAASLGPPAAPPAAQAAGERRGRPYVSASLTARAAATHR